MKKYLALFCSFFIMAFYSCKSDQGSNTTSQEKVAVTSQANSGPQFESIPQDIMMRVWNEVDLLDYIFHNLPFSMSQDEQASIRSNVGYIAQETQTNIPEGCRPIARQFYQTAGDIFLEADIYFDENCQFYVFFIDGKASYANKMSPSGVSFFKTMISKALNASQSGGQ